MAMGRRKTERQEPLCITADTLPKSSGHPFYQALNRLPAEAGFDRWIEDRCLPYYDNEQPRGQRSLPPGVYFRMLPVGDFRMLPVGDFEGSDSQRGSAWRCADGLSLRGFPGLALDQHGPDHSTLSLTRRRLPPEVFDEVFRFVLRIAADKRLPSGKTAGVDSTTLEADAAMKSIIRRDTGEGWKAYVTRLMREEGAISEDEEPSDEEVRRFDRRRKRKQVSNEAWVSPGDPEARITRMKDGTTHPAYKAEHVVDLESDLIVAAEIRTATEGDSWGDRGGRADAGRERDAGSGEPVGDRVRRTDRRQSDQACADPRGGRRQGVSLGRRVGTLPLSGPADLHPRTAAPQ